MIIGQLVRADSNPRLDARSAGEAFNAIPMKTAVARPCIARQPRDSDEAHLGTAAAAERLAVRDDTNADTCAHCDIRQVMETLGCAPLSFAERRAIHVRVEANRNAELLRKATGDPRVAPARLGGRGDVAIGRRRTSEVERTEGRETERFERAMA